MSADDRNAENTTGAPAADSDLVRRYEIRVKGRLGAHWSAWFDGLSLTDAADGTTVISGPVADQSALHGLLQKLRDVGIPLVSLTPVQSESSTQPHERD